MIAVDRPAAPPAFEQAIHLIPRPLGRRKTPLNDKVYAAFLLTAVFLTIDGGWLLDTGTALVLQSRGAALHAYWGLMRAEGVPGEELARLEEEWMQTQETMVLGAGETFWWPGASSQVNRWQVETEAIWSRSLAQSREAALATRQNLNQVRAKGPLLESKAGFEAFGAAQTPAEFNALRSEWGMEAKLVAIDKLIAGAAAMVAGQADKAKSLGIRSDPAPDFLSVTGAYSELLPRERMAKAEFLARRLGSLQKDLQGRLEAAAVAQQVLQRAADLVAAAELYGIDVSGFLGRIANARGAYANALQVSEFSEMAAAANQVAAEADHSIAVALSQTHIVSGVQFIYQNHPLSCEEAATSMALTHQGIHVSQDQILAELGADTRPMYVDAQGRVRWGNPYQTFVGNVNGSESNWTGFGTYYPPLVRIARAHGAQILQYGNMSAATIYARLTAGHPVVVFSTWDWQWHPRRDYLSFDGQWIPWIGPAVSSHVYTAVGVSPTHVLINDPIRGQYWVGKAAFEAAYSDFNEAIVFA